MGEISFKVQNKYLIEHQYSFIDTDFIPIYKIL